jgi:endo-alpha-1,4-polygalactosaminidase (GH114 family)
VNVMEFAEQDGVDPVQEMIWFIGDINEFVKTRCRECVLVAQNAAELVVYPEYVEVIDALAQEQVWFDGGADNDPEGDCPLPRTESEIDTDAYYDSLPSECQRQFDEYPESTLHVSSEEYLYYLEIAAQGGLPVFTVDYALEPENVTWIYQTSRALGYIPFVGNRGLDIYLPPVP